MTQTDQPIESLSRRVDEAIEAFRASTPGPSSDETWGPHEALAHLIFWHRYAGEAMRVAAEGGRHLRPLGNMAEINGRAVEQYRGLTKDQLIDEFRQAHEVLVARYRSMPDPNAFVMTRATGEEASATQTLNNWIRHIGEHLEELRG